MSPRPCGTEYSQSDPEAFHSGLMISTMPRSRSNDGDSPTGSLAISIKRLV